MDVNDIKKLTKYFKLLGDANRLAILQAIDGSEQSVSGIITVTGLSQPLVSFHLRALREAGMVVARRQGPFIKYSLVYPEMIGLLKDFYRLLGLETDVDGTAIETGPIKLRKSAMLWTQGV